MVIFLCILVSTCRFHLYVLNGDDLLISCLYTVLLVRCLVENPLQDFQLKSPINWRPVGLSTENGFACDDVRVDFPQDAVPKC